MSGVKHPYLDAEPERGDADQTQPAIGKRNRTAGDELRFSSPWPWIFAAIVSLAMWASIAWLVWAAIG
jgi:hypothetical protein